MLPKLKPTNPVLPPIQTAKKTKKKEAKKERIQQQRIDEIINDKAIKWEQEDSLKIAIVKGKKQLVETDKLFIQSIQAIAHSQENVLHELMGAKDHALTDQQCNEIHYRAKLHRRANMININGALTKKQLGNKPELRSLFCKCGCDRFKGKSYPVCQDMQQLSFLGSGILLFFSLLKGLVLSTTIMFLAYTCVAMALYSSGDNYVVKVPGNCNTSFCQFKNRYSSYNQSNPNNTFPILDWIGLAVMMVWIFISRLIKHYGFVQNTLIDKNLKSSSDFAIKVDNLPAGGYSQEELFQFFEQQYERKVKEIQSTKDIAHDILAHAQDHLMEDTKIHINRKGQVQPSQNRQSDDSLNQDRPNLLQQIGNQLLKDIKEEDELNHFHIRSIQVIYKMEFSRKILEKLLNTSLEINRMFKEVENQIVIEDKDQYQQLKKEVIGVYQTMEDLRKKFLNDSAFRQKIATHSALVEFRSEKDKTLVMENLGHENLTLYKKVKQSFQECVKGSSLTMFKGQIPYILRAPQPSDILWQNCEKQFSFLRIFGIYFVTFIVIMISLGIIAGVQAIQFQLQNTPITSQPSTLVTFLNALASIVLTVVNAVLWILLKSLLNYEYNHTITNKITSLMGKASFATWINIIVIPIVVNYIFYGQYYGSEGVAGLVIDYQVAALAASLPLMLFNPLQMIISLLLKVKCLRSYIIRLKYRKKEGEQEIAKDGMKKVYQFYEPPEFVIEQAYVFILPNVMQALFFCQLQPVLIIFALAQTFLFYWVCKIRVLKLCKIPVLTDRLIFQVAIYHVMLAPIFYGVGSLVNSYIVAQINHSVSFSFLGAAICIGLGMINYFNPGNVAQRIVECFANCFPCLRAEHVYKNLYERTNNNSEENQNIRLENYYRNSNSLSLLGFEKVIMGKAKSEEIEIELRKFCEGHVGAYQYGDREDGSISLSEGSHQFQKMESKKMMVANIFE